MLSITTRLSLFICRPLSDVARFPVQLFCSHIPERMGNTSSGKLERRDKEGGERKGKEGREGRGREAGRREQKGHSRITPNLDEKKPVHTTIVFADIIMLLYCNFIPFCSIAWKQ